MLGTESCPPLPGCSHKVRHSSENQRARGEPVVLAGWQHPTDRSWRGFMNRITRRTFVGSLGAAATMPAFSASHAAPGGPIITRAIPKSGEKIPMIGLGTWITFNVGNDEKLRAARAQVIQTLLRPRRHPDRFLADVRLLGGRGGLRAGAHQRPAQFCATKVWTMFKPIGVDQMENSRKLWGVERFDLLQVHNLLDWRAHLATLQGDGRRRAACATSVSRPRKAAARRPRQHHAHRTARVRAVHL